MRRSRGLLSNAGEVWRSSSRLQVYTYAAVDVVIVCVSALVAYALRFDGAVPRQWAEGIPLMSASACLVFVVLFLVFGLYHLVWKYVGVDMIVRLAEAVGIGTVVLTVGVFVVDSLGRWVIPRSIPVLIGVFVFVGAAAFRSVGRLLVYAAVDSGAKQYHVLIVGAGDAGSLLLRDIENQPELDIQVVGFLDDQPAKQGRRIRNVPVLGGIETLPSVVQTKGIDQVYIAIPRATVAERRRILDLCNQVQVSVRLIAGLTPTGTVGVADFRSVNIEDLLGRDPVCIDEALIRETLEGRVVAVTGAAGSIGSELCRQILAVGPSRLLLVEVDETRLYELWLELERSHPGVCLVQLMDIRDEPKVESVFLRERPNVVFHAAAYKHVPLMEIAPDEAVTANVGGTSSVIRACEAAGVEKFVLISTDKAVAPANVMGATKAIAERIVMLAADRGLRATAVRFGNVLGSRGSVVPLFAEQLRQGGPIKVTHPDVTRYFMTIPEAARLVLQAQAMSAGGDIFVLDMGEPVRIVDLAKKMIALSGSDATIEYTSLRAGEKLHEELVHPWSSLSPTACPSVSRVAVNPKIDSDFGEAVQTLAGLARRGECDAVWQMLANLLPDFTPSRPEWGSSCSVSNPDLPSEHQ